MQQMMRILVFDKDHEIPLILTLPDQLSEAVPVVVLCHGTGSDKNEVGDLFVHLAQQLCQQGIASIRFDFIGTGESTENYLYYTLSSSVDDVKSMVTLIHNDSRLDSNRIGILGFSQGGTIALLSAGRLQQFSTLVTWSGAPDLRGMLTEEQKKEARCGSVDFPFDFRSSLWISKEWLEEVEQTDVLEEFAKCSIPTLAIAGTKDTLIPCIWSQRIKEASHHLDSEVMLVEADHIFNVFDQPEISKQIIARTCDWMKQYLAK